MRVDPRIALLTLLLGLGLALLSLPTRAGEPPLARALTVEGIAFREVPAEADRGGLAQAFQVRLERDGRVGLRLVVPRGPGGAGSFLGAWRFTDEAAADRSVLEGLRRAMIVARRDPERGGDPKPDPIGEGAAAIRLVVDAAPEVPWVRSAWVVQAATHHALMLFRLTFLAQREGTWCNLDLPRAIDRGWPPPGQAVQARRLVVHLFRNGMEGPPERRFTRARASLESLEVWVDPDGFPQTEQMEPPETPVPDPPLTTIDLVPSPFVPPQDASAWSAFEAYVAQRGSEPLHFAELRMPRPVGTVVPTSDVVEVLRRLERAGYEKVLLDNPAEPGAPPGEDPPRIEDLGR